MDIRPLLAHEEQLSDNTHEQTNWLQDVKTDALNVEIKKDFKIHSVQFYKQSEILCQTVSRYAYLGLQRSEAVILIATQDHREQIARQLEVMQVPVSELQSQGQLVIYDAEETLSQFMVDGLPNRQLFLSVVGKTLDELLSRYTHVRAYGEMVQILWENGNLQGTIQLENLWNQIQNHKSFSLLCGYSLQSFNQEIDGVAFSDVCSCHNHLLPVETSTQENKINDYLKVIAQLQQKTMDLQKEVAERKSIEAALRKSEKELQVAKEAAEAASYTKSRFLANMSHEIRSPLTGILGFTELLKDKNLSEADRSSYFEIIARNGRQLSSLINDILDLSKAETNKLEIESVPLSLMAIAADVVKRYQAELQAKEISIRLVDTPAHFPSIIYSDPGRIQQVLLNLIGNAIKFTPSGEIRISFESTVRPSDGAITVGIRVQDSGIGMTSEQQNRLFQPFIQADSSATRKYGGTGLGLVLSKKIAHALGGDVVIVKSAKDKGSTFLATFNSHIHDISQINNHYTAYEAERNQRQLLENRLAGARILYAEDSPDNQLLIRKYLSASGAYVDIAENGAVAVEMALAGDYHLILMDVMMPVCDGYDATRRLRRAGYSKPIIALTAHALPEERSRSITEGCSEHLTKPISREHLVSVVHKYVFEEQDHFHFLN